MENILKSDNCSLQQDQPQPNSQFIPTLKITSSKIKGKSGYRGYRYKGNKLLIAEKTPEEYMVTTEGHNGILITKNKEFEFSLNSSNQYFNLI